jgi:hypothetical protein
MTIEVNTLIPFLLYIQDVCDLSSDANIPGRECFLPNANARIRYVITFTQIPNLC